MQGHGLCEGSLWDRVECLCDVAEGDVQLLVECARVGDEGGEVGSLMSGVAAFASGSLGVVEQPERVARALDFAPSVRGRELVQNALKGEAAVVWQVQGVALALVEVDELALGELRAEENCVDEVGQEGEKL